MSRVAQVNDPSDDSLWSDSGLQRFNSTFKYQLSSIGTLT